MSKLAEDELAVCNRILIRSIRSALVSTEDRAEDEFVPTRFKGLDRVTSKSSEIFQTAVANHARLHGMPKFLGGLATVVFAGLAAGPLWAVYREFFGAWSGAFTGAAEMKWQTFPSPSAGMVFATLLLLVLPVAILALISSLLSAPKARVQAAMREVRTNHDAMLECLTSEGVIRLESDDPVREAVRQVLHFLRPESTARLVADRQKIEKIDMKMLLDENP